MKNKRWIDLGVMIFFLSMLFLVSSSFCGSENVAKYNNGFGTFDMKQYNETMVYDVLQQAELPYFHSVKVYYIVDYIFCIAFFAFQCFGTSNLFKKVSSPLPRYVHIVVAAVRGLADIMENTLLLIVISSFPVQHTKLVALASTFTQMKLKMIVLWMLIMGVGFLFNFIGSRKVVHTHQ